MSDISQVFQVDDILTLSENITASERRGLGEKTGILSLAPSSVFLSKCLLLDHGSLFTLTSQYFKIAKIRYHRYYAGFLGQPLVIY